MSLQEKKNLVSVIMPSFNVENFIGKSIASVLEQTYENFELIIIDDCSNDQTIKVIKKYMEKDQRIILIENNKNTGGAVSRNKGIEKARGEFIAFLDSDDMWVKEKLEKQIEFMIKNNYDFTCTAYEIILENGEKTGNKINPKSKINYNNALYYNPVGCLTAVYNCEKLEKMYMPLIKKRQDYALWLKILKKTECYSLNENLAFLRVRKNSLSSNKISLIKWHWKLMREVEKIGIIKTIFLIVTQTFHKMFK